MKKFVSAFVFVVVALFSTTSFSYNSDPKIFIAELIEDAINTLSNKNITITKQI